MDPDVVLKVLSLLLASDVFPEINMKAIPIPVSRRNAPENDDDLRTLGKAKWLSYYNIGSALMRSIGNSDKLLKDYWEELNNPRRNMIHWQAFMWPRKASSQEEI
ncbi:hypothetical protein M422DRAFT_263590 [Sphaerobolus stellatus SS14]|uniref:Uncharacterized protein n=1 Tax=Sphaerobolus stellatus (strain SS14) TaxID=990650 RepID=A0A0C9U8W9_SPHS4|nr:hypothetical protein M422DRAFT_55975 [Sphaerobolus stellatus SS14]KIJ34276.1 hypothetical protein M422DRAFT_263590 [Sphaerobolus stellatus SS14]